MDLLTVSLIALAIPVLLYLWRMSRRRTYALPKAGARMDALPPGERQTIRTRIVQEADRLCDLEEEVLRFAEGSDSGLSDRADRVRAEAVSLRKRLEAECQRYRLPLALVRRRRSGQLVRTVGIDRPG